MSTVMVPGTVYTDFQGTPLVKVVNPVEANIGPFTVEYTRNNKRRGMPCEEAWMNDDNKLEFKLNTEPLICQAQFAPMQFIYIPT